jgi:8-oxo-dGTP pyrophosphatase MutT (NUDIX family)
VRVKRTSRLIVLDKQNRVLMFRVVDKSVADPRLPARANSSLAFWITPGGSLEPGESHEAAARRELWEETGIATAELGPWVWTDERQLSWNGEPVQMHERYFLIRVNQANVQFQRLSSQEQTAFRDYKWWTVASLQSTDETIFPLGFGDLVSELTEGRIPPMPIPLHERKSGTER